jgi:uncharacterized protein YbjT (DUF2867 family)
MSKGPILVTGAAPGSQGSTGWHIVRQLRQKNVPVRAFVRTIDKRSDELRGLGAEVVQGDLLDYGSVKRAMTASAASSSPTQWRLACWMRPR